MNRTDDMKNDFYKMEAMRSMGWDMDADIPMANEENLQILKEMEHMSELKFKLNEQIRSYDERDKTIQRHKQNIEAALNKNLTFLNTIQHDAYKENHRYQLAHLERCKVNEDLRNNQREYEKFVDYKNGVDRKIVINKNEINDLTKRIKSAKMTLIEWNEAMEDSNKGYQLIDKYYRDDQQRARELNQRRQNLQSDIDKRRRIVVAKYDEQLSLEKNLERTATLYRNAHLERRQMVETWKNAVNQMTQRETDIQQGENLLDELRSESRAKANDYAYHNERLDKIIENNRQVEASIEEINVETSDIKNQISQLIDLSYLKQREIDGLQKDLANLANHLELQRTENRLRQKEKMDKEDEMESFGDLLKDIEKRLEAMQNTNLNASQRLQILEDMNDNEQKALHAAEKETERISDVLYRTLESIAQLKDDEKRLTVNNSALTSTIIAKERNRGNIEKLVQRQVEIHYNMAFKYLEAERKLNMLKGNTVDPELDMRNAEILGQLEQYYAKLQRRKQVTEAQNKKLNYSMITMTNAYNNDNKELNDARFKIKEAQVYCEGSMKRLKERKLDNQEHIVEINLLKMRCNDLQSEINRYEKGSFSLDQHRLELKRSVKDRLIELKSQEELLQLKRKHLCEELSTLRADLGERKKHIEAMRARFELTSKLLGTNEDGTLVTTTQLKVQTAQEKQLLADEGDELNKKVLKAEKEVIALENTLRQFDKSNDQYRKNFKKEDTNVNVKAEEDLKQMQYEYCQLIDELKTLRCKVQRVDYQLEELKKRQEEYTKNYTLMRTKHEENLETYDKLVKELNDQNSKMLRAEREIKIAMKQFKERPISDDYLSMFQYDFDLRELERRNLSTLNQLCDLTAHDPEGPEILDLMIEKGVRMPQHLKRTRSCISWKSESSSSLLSCGSVTNKRGSIISSSSSESKPDDNASCHLSVVSLDFSGIL